MPEVTPKIYRVGHPSPRDGPQDGPKIAQNGPTCPQAALSWIQDGLKMALKLAQAGPRWPTVSQRWPQDGPSWPQDALKMAPRWPEDSPEMAPRWSQNGPNYQRLIATIRQAKLEGAAVVPEGTVNKSTAPEGEHGVLNRLPNSVNC